MENPRGRIIAVRRADAGSSALVEVDAAASCARCAAGKGCGAGLLGGMAGPRRVEVLIGNNLSLREGDEVRIALAPSHLLRAAMTVYGVPLSLAVAAAAFAYFLELGDLAAAIAALCGIVAGLFVARSRLRKSSCLRDFTPTVVERIAIQREVTET